MKTMKLAVVASSFALMTGVSAFAQDTTTTTTPTTTESTSTPSSDSTSYDSYRGSERRNISPGGLYLEPILSVSRDESTIKTSQLPLLTDDTSGTSDGAGLGLKFGVHVNEMFLIGLDARYTRQKMKDSFYSDANADVYNIAPMVAVQTPIWGIRLSGAYIAAGENNPESGIQGLDLKFKEGTGYRVGAGVHVGPVAVNLEYQDIKYNKTEIESLGSIAANKDTPVDADSQGYAVTVSFPIEL